MSRRPFLPLLCAALLAALPAAAQDAPGSFTLEEPLGAVIAGGPLTETTDVAAPGRPKDDVQQRANDREQDDGGNQEVGLVA